MLILARLDIKKSHRIGLDYYARMAAAKYIVLEYGWLWVELVNFAKEGRDIQAHLSGCTVVVFIIEVGQHRTLIR